MVSPFRPQPAPAIIAPEPATMQFHVPAPARPRGLFAFRVALFAMLAVALILLPTVRTVKIVGDSMKPTFETGQLVVALRAYKLLAPLKAGDVVIARPTMGETGGDEVIKRVLFIQNAEGNAPFPRHVTINGARIGTLALFPEEFLGRKKLQPGEIYLLGDNWRNSVDSRDYGPVRESEILGKVIFQPAANEAAWTTTRTAQAAERRTATIR